jgi:hypothetical protein
MSLPDYVFLTPGQYVPSQFAGFPHRLMLRLMASLTASTKS